MLRPRIIVLSASLLAIAAATPLTAQRLEVGGRLGYSTATGTQFRQTFVDGSVTRSWDGGGFSVGALGSYWPLTHFGIQGTVDLRLTRAHASERMGLLGPVPGPSPETRTTQLVASVRLAARQAVGRRLQLAASVGPAMIRFGGSEYGDGPFLDSLLVHRIAYGVAGGVSATCSFSSRLRLTVSAEDAVYRAQQTSFIPNPMAPVPNPLASVEAPWWQAFSVSVAVGAWVL